MSRVIVTVQRAGDPRTRELELSAGVPWPRLAEMVSRALGWDQDPSGDRSVFQIEVLPLGRRLLGGESLAGAGAWDGSWLIFHQVGTEPRPVPTAPPPPPPSFEQVWDPIVDPPTDFGFSAHHEPTPPPGQVQEVAPIRLDPHVGWRETRHVSPVDKEQADPPLPPAVVPLTASPVPAEPMPAPAASASPAPYDPPTTFEPLPYDPPAPYELPAWYEPMPLPSFDPLPLPLKLAASPTAGTPTIEPTEPASAAAVPGFGAASQAEDPPTGFPGALPVEDDQPTVRVILPSAPAQPPATDADPDVPPFRSPDEPPVEQPLRGFRPWRSRKKSRSTPAQPPADTPPDE